MCLKSFNLLNALSMRQRRTSTEPSQSYSSSTSDRSSRHNRPRQLLSASSSSHRGSCARPDRSRSGCLHLAGAGELKVPGYKRVIIASQSWGQLGSNGRRSRKGLCRRSTMADRANIWTQARRQRLAKKHFDAIRTAHPRDRSAARVYRPFLRLGMDRCKRAPLNG
jgi:hypothetical protein